MLKRYKVARVKRYKVAQDREGKWGILDRLRGKFAPFGKSRVFWQSAVSAVLMFDTGDLDPRDLLWEAWKPRTSVH